MVRREKMKRVSSLTFSLKYTGPHYVEDDVFPLKENIIYP